MLEGPKTSIEKIEDNLKLSTLYHVGNKCESVTVVTAEGKKYASLVENDPHSFGNTILRVFPPVSTRIQIVVGIILQHIVSIKARMG